LDTYHPDTLNLHQSGHEDMWLVFKAKKGLWARIFGKHCTKWSTESVQDV